MKIKKIIIAILIAVVFPSAAYAYFTSTYVSPGHVLSSASLKTEIIPNDPIEEEITDEENVEFSFELRNSGDVSNQNELLFSEITNETFAEKINVVVEKENVEIYSGNLVEVEIHSWIQTAGLEETISFTFSISQDDFSKTYGEEVIFKIENLASQLNLEYGNGFFDQDYVEVKLINSGEELKNPAAPAVATKLLRDADIKPQYFEDGKPGNYITDVAHHMGPQTDFCYPEEEECIKKTDAENYRYAVALFLRDKGLDVAEELFEEEDEDD